jgi:hypothetical protein
MNQTRSGAEELASRMRTDTAEDIRKILGEMEMARAAAEDELEAQRLLTETARVRSFTVGLNVEDARAETAQTSSARRAKKPLKRATSAKKRTAKAKAKAVKPLSRPVHLATKRPEEFFLGSFLCAGHQSNAIPACVGVVQG